MDDEQNTQLEFWGLNGLPHHRSPNCIVGDLLEESDCACRNLIQNKHEVLECGSKKSVQFISDIGGLDLTHLVTKPVVAPTLPPFVPEIPKGRVQTVKLINSSVIAVKLTNLINPRTLSVDFNFRQNMGISSSTKVVLLNYAHDTLIEKIWTNRHTVFPAIASLDVDFMTGFDYSVFMIHPHMERLINLSRGIFSAIQLQKYGAQAIPHLYWSGPKDIARLGVWLNNSPQTKMVATYIGLSRNKPHWKATIEGIRLLNEITNRRITFLVSGPSTRIKINQLIATNANIVLTSSKPVQKASNYRLITEKYPTGFQVATRPVNENIAFFEDLMRYEVVHADKSKPLSDPIKKLMRPAYFISRTQKNFNFINQQGRN